MVDDSRSEQSAVDLALSLKLHVSGGASYFYITQSASTQKTDQFNGSFSCRANRMLSVPSCMTITVSSTSLSS